MSRRLLSTSLAIVFVCQAAVSLQAQEWTRFRGLNGSGISDATTVPVKWDEGDFNWKIELPGIGHGSPVVWGDRLFLLAESDEGQERLVLCIDTTTGKELWRKAFDSKTHRKHRKNSYASSTPAVDEERVYVAWATPEQLSLTALDHNGTTLWQTDLGPYKAGHGFASSPIVYNGMVVLGNDQDGPSSLIAVDCETGKIRWQVSRNSDRATYSTPCIYEYADGREHLIFTNWRRGITAVDPESGATVWERSVFDQSHSERAIGSPIVAGDLVIGSCGFTTAQKHVVALRPSADNQSDNVEEVIRIERAVPHIPSVLAHEGLLFLWNDQGIVSAYRLKDGERIWQQRVGGNFFGSPVCVNGKLYSVSDEGEVVVVAASEEFEELARNKMDEGSHSTPAVAGGTMFVRTFSHLYSIGGPSR